MAGYWPTLWCAECGHAFPVLIKDLPTRPFSPFDDKAVWELLHEHRQSVACGGGPRER